MPRRDVPRTHCMVHQAAAPHSCMCKNMEEGKTSSPDFDSGQANAAHSCMCRGVEENKTGSPDFHSGPGCTGGQLHIRASRVQVAGSAPPKSPICSGLLLHLLNHLLHGHKQGCYASALHLCYRQLQSIWLAFRLGPLWVATAAYFAGHCYGFSKKFFLHLALDGQHESLGCQFSIRSFVVPRL